jgi:signal transduction histidine kinase
VLAIVSLLIPLGLSLRDRVGAEVRLQARSEAEVVAARASTLVSGGRTAALAALARAAASAVHGRVVIVDAHARIVADSSGPAQVGTVYANRPEIAAALTGDVSQVRRQSRTLDAEILATATPILDAGRRVGAVRVTQSIASVNAAVRRTWLGLALVGALVLGLGLVVVTLIARRVARPILELNDAATRVGAGDLTTRARVEGSAEQQTLARSFNAMTDRLATLLAAQKDFVADASHQLRTPLSGLRLRLEDAQATSTDARLRTELAACLRETDRLTHIVDELLELSRAGEEQQAAATTDPAGAVRRARDRFAASAAAAGCALHATSGPSDDVAVVCHASDLDRMLDVLVENAIAYAPGTPIELVADGPTIRVRDHGPGLAPGEAEGAFERFRRGRAAQSGPAGSGLGLAIARELARRWGGDVTAGDTPGGGATMAISLRAAEPS